MLLAAASAFASVMRNTSTRHHADLVWRQVDQDAVVSCRLHAPFRAGQLRISGVTASTKSMSPRNATAVFTTSRNSNYLVDRSIGSTRVWSPKDAWSRLRPGIFFQGDYKNRYATVETPYPALETHGNGCYTNRYTAGQKHKKWPDTSYPAIS